MQGLIKLGRRALADSHRLAPHGLVGFSRRRRLVAVLFAQALVVACFAARAQMAFSPSSFARSVSDQFIVTGRGVETSLAKDNVTKTNRSEVRLSPALVAVSCERIKQTLWRELGETDPWRGKIFIALRPPNGPDDGVTILSERFRDGWHYRVDMPNQVDRLRYTRAIVQAVIQERANRGAGDRSADVPAWLTEGFARWLLATEEKEIILETEVTLSSLEARSTGAKITRKAERLPDPLKAAHELLRSNRPLTFDELSWPADNGLAGEAGEIYGASAMLFVRELVRLPDGPACFRAMFDDLPRHYNWQFAFLTAFKSSFKRPLEVEKWWTLKTVSFTGRELSQVWSSEEAWQKLDEALKTPIEVRATTNAAPSYGVATLQTIIREWQRARQAEALQDRDRDLAALRLRVGPDLATLIDEYRRALEIYLREPDKAILSSVFGIPGTERSSEKAIKKLDALDARRALLKPEAQPIASRP
jgi:hypothetical protein